MDEDDRQIPLPLEAVDVFKTNLLIAKSIAARWKTRLDDGGQLPPEDVLRGEMHLVVVALLGANPNPHK